MIGCERARELISCLIDGELSEKEKSEVSEHIETCPECKAVFDAFFALSDDLTVLEEAPEGLTENVMSAIKEGIPAKRRTPWVRYLSLAACLALVIFAGTKLGVPKSNDCAESVIAEDSGQAVCDESVCADCEPADDCGDAPEDRVVAAPEAEPAACEPEAKSKAYDSLNTFAAEAASDPDVILIRSDGASAFPDDDFISRLKTETKGSADESRASEPDYTLSLPDGTEYKIFVSGGTVTVHCGERVYAPDLSVEDIEKLFE